MLSIAFSLLATALAADPKPAAGDRIDRVHYHFPGSPSGLGLGPSGWLTISRDGQLSYSHAPAPHTGSGGFATQKDWEVPAGEAAALIRGLAEDGLLELPDGP